MDTTQDLAQFLTDVERSLLEHITTSLQQRKMTQEEAQQLARDFLSLLPPKDKEDLLNKLHTLSTKYDEANAVYLEYARKDEEQKRDYLLHQMSMHIKNGEIEKAIAIAKGGVQ